MAGGATHRPVGKAMTTRRRLVGGLAAGGIGSVGAHASTVVVRAQGSTPVPDPGGDTPVGEATAPQWAVIVATLQDPYAGEIQAPSDPPSGVRFVAAEVVIDNGSSQALNFTPADIRLVDASGIEYRGGAAAGTEPFLGVRNLNGGDRSRGWVWFIVPEDAEITELVYVAPPPLFRIPLDP